MAQIIKPEDMVVAFGIPLSRTDFDQDKHSVASKDFVKNCCGCWSKYYYDFVKHVNRVEPAMKAWGTTVIHNLTFAEFGRLFNMNRYEAIILFSHWNRDSVEFYDGMVNIPRIVQAIPHEFAGVLDLCVCRPKKLVDMLQYERPNCLVRFIDKDATASFWIYFYLTFLKFIADRDLTYFDALEQVIDVLLNIEQKGAQ